MKKVILLLSLISFLVGCNKETDTQTAYVDKLTTEEAKVVSSYLLGKSIEQNEAVSEAESVIAFFDQNSATTRSSARKIGNIIIAKGAKSQTRSSDSADTLAYIINFADDMGYAVISADRRTETILAISPNGNIDPENEETNPGLDIFFANAGDMYEQQIASAEQQEALLLNEALTKMNEANTPSTRAVGYTTKVGEWETYSTFAPLVKVQWGQTSPYNDNAPLVNGKRAYAGCVATAVAQIMSYHRYPTNYNWVQINQNTWHYQGEGYNDPAHPLIASLFRTIGDNVKMNWGSDPKNGSGAYSSDVPACFSKMGYKKYGAQRGYDINTITASISSGSPVYISGASTYYTHRHWFLGSKHTHYEGGHAWVIDGYLHRKRKVDLLSGNTVIYSYYEYEQLVHCNYGWDGGSNGYYNSAAFNTNSGPVTRGGEAYNYQFELKIIPNIKPL